MEREGTDRLDDKLRFYRRTALPVVDEIGYVSIAPQTLRR